MNLTTNITPHLWFTDHAEDAMKYYCEVFPNSRIVGIQRYPEDESVDPHFVSMGGKVLNGQFELCGQPFMCIDGGEQTFELNEAVSFVISCEGQAEVDYYWEKLSADPDGGQCGWCKDKFGVHWQVIPANLGELLTNAAQMQAMMQMKKFNIAELEALADA